MAQIRSGERTTHLNAILLITPTINSMVNKEPVEEKNAHDRKIDLCQIKKRLICADSSSSIWCPDARILTVRPRLFSHAMASLRVGFMHGGCGVVPGVHGDTDM